MADFGAAELFTFPAIEFGPGGEAQAFELFAIATADDYMMLAQDQGRPAGSNYSVWKSTGSPDFAGAGYAGSSPTPVGAMVVGSVRILARIS